MSILPGPPLLLHMILPGPPLLLHMILPGPPLLLHMILPGPPLLLHMILPGPPLLLHMILLLQLCSPAQRVPGPVVKPVQEVVEAMLHHVGCGPVVEPGIELVDDALEPEDENDSEKENDDEVYDNDPRVLDLMTANSLDEKPARQARASTLKVIRLLAPLGLRSAALLVTRAAGAPLEVGGTTPGEAMVTDLHL